MYQVYRLVQKFMCLDNSFKQALIKDKHQAISQIQSCPTLGSDALASSGSGAGLEYSPESKPWPSFALNAKQKRCLRKKEGRVFLLLKSNTQSTYNQTDIEFPFHFLSCKATLLQPLLVNRECFSKLRHQTCGNNMLFTHTCVLKS